MRRKRRKVGLLRRFGRRSRTARGEQTLKTMGTQPGGTAITANRSTSGFRASAWDSTLDWSCAPARARFISRRHASTSSSAIGNGHPKASGPARSKRSCTWESQVGRELYRLVGVRESPMDDARVGPASPAAGR